VKVKSFKPGKCCSGGKKKKLKECLDKKTKGGTHAGELESKEEQGDSVHRTMSEWGGGKKDTNDSEVLPGEWNASKVL